MKSLYKVLVLVDVQNLYYGAKNLSSDKTIDYKLLMDFLKEKVSNLIIHDLFEIDFYGYVVQTPSYQGLNFFAFLRSIGYKLKVKVCGLKEEESERGSVGANIQLDAVDKASEYDAIIIASGSGILEPAFRAIKHNWPKTLCCISAFKNTLHKIYQSKKTLERSVVDYVFILDETVLKS
jgi:uncharacterized LabA/DUF88 family protein